MGFSASTLANFSLASQAAGGAVSAFGAYSQASGQKASLRAQAAVAEANARIDELGAQATLRDSQLQIADTTRRYGQLKSSQRATMAANGVAVDAGGSAAELQDSTEFLKDADTATLQITAVRAAFGQRMQAGNQRTQAAMSRANSSAINPGLAMGTSLLGGAGRVADSWYQLKGNRPQTLAPAGDPIHALYTLNNGWE